tara:strand:+ start:380 stop:541 length:162 start_codon:yes stop_codon:yes gene_type:complete
MGKLLVFSNGSLLIVYVFANFTACVLYKVFDARLVVDLSQRKTTKTTVYQPGV